MVHSLATEPAAELVCVGGWATEPATELSAPLRSTRRAGATEPAAELAQLELVLQSLLQSLLS